LLELLVGVAETTMALMRTVMRVEKRMLLDLWDDGIVRV